MQEKAFLAGGLFFAGEVMEAGDKKTGIIYDEDMIKHAVL
jgi:hypothetical protein